MIVTSPQGSSCPLYPPSVPPLTSTLTSSSNVDIADIFYSFLDIWGQGDSFHFPITISTSFQAFLGIPGLLKSHCCSSCQSPRQVTYLSTSLHLAFHFNLTLLPCNMLSWKSMILETDRVEFESYLHHLLGNAPSVFLSSPSQMIK